MYKNQCKQRLNIINFESKIKVKAKNSTLCEKKKYKIRHIYDNENDNC